MRKPRTPFWTLLGAMGAATTLLGMGLLAGTPVAHAEPQAIRAMTFDPGASLDAGSVEDWRGMDHIIGVGGEVTYAADSIVFRTVDGVYALPVVQDAIGQPDGDA